MIISRAYSPIYRAFTESPPAFGEWAPNYVRKITSSRLNIITESESATAAYSAVEPKITAM